MKLKFPKIKGANAKYLGLGIATLAFIAFVMFAPKFVKKKEENQAINAPITPVPSAIQPALGPVSQNPFGLLPLGEASQTIYGPLSTSGLARANRVYNNMIGISAYRGRVSMG